MPTPLSTSIQRYGFKLHYVWWLVGNAELASIQKCLNILSCASIIVKWNGSKRSKISLLRKIFFATQTFSVLNDPKDVYRVPEKVSRQMVLHERLMRDEQAGSGDSQRLSLRPSVFRMLQDALSVSCWGNGI